MLTETMERYAEETDLAWFGDINDGKWKKIKIEKPKQVIDELHIKQFVRAVVLNKAFELKPTVLKSGITSPFYINMRKLNDPDSLRVISILLKDIIKNIHFDYIVAIPYAAIPMATLVSQETKVPLLYIRKEKKEYGDSLDDLIVGNRVSDKRKCLLIDDVLTNGKSKYEQVELLKQAGLEVTDIVTLIDRTTVEEKQNKESYIQKLTQQGIKFHTILHIDEFLDLLIELYPDVYNKESLKEVYSFLGLPYYNNYSIFAKKLLKLMQQKNSYIIPSADFTDSVDLINFVSVVGQYVPAIKIHADIITNWGYQTYIQLIQLKQLYNFYIIEDRKFVDIGNTLSLQLQNTHFDYLFWADSVTAVPLSGAKSLIEGLTVDNKKIPAFLLTPTTTEESFKSDEYISYIRRLYIENLESFCGTVGGIPVLKPEEVGLVPYYMHLRPGISENRKKDAKGQTYLTVDEAFDKYGKSLTGIIVGRDLMTAYKESIPKTVEMIQSMNEKIIRCKSA